LQVVATFREHPSDSKDEKNVTDQEKIDDLDFIAIAEGVDMPIYAFTYNIEMTQFFFEDASMTLDENILDHSLIARKHAQYIANQIAEEGRFCEHSFDSMEEVFANSIKHMNWSTVEYESQSGQNTMPTGLHSHDIYLLQ